MVLVGVAGWSYADWNGTVYPSRKRRGFHPLPYLARYLGLMELNSSYYALPQAEHATGWRRMLEPFPDFQFTAKLHSSFTHGSQAQMRADTAVAFRAGLAPLREAGRLLASLAQFPVSFQATREGWARLERIRHWFAEDELVLELRHRSWFGDAELNRLKGMDVSLAHIDLPAAADHPPEGHGSLGPIGYLRVHGRNRRTWFDAKAGRDQRYNYRYPRPEVEHLAKRMQEVDRTTERSLLVTNNHYGGQAVANALELKGLLEGIKPRAPETLVQTFPDLQPWVQAEGQMPLF